MGKKFKVLLVIMALSFTLCLMSNTYSRYVAGTTGNVEASFAKWQILVNSNDITSNASSNIVLTPTIDANTNVKANTIAPSSTGYFDIEIDPSNVDVSFNYAINLSIENKNMPDLVITKYSIIDSSYKEGDELQKHNITENSIQGSLLYNNSINNYKFEPFTIRIHFEWYEGTNEKMNDEQDTIAGTSENNTFKINATISFNQKIN